jgi:la-related protein 1
MASGEISQPAAPTFSYAQAAKAASLAKKVKANPDSVESTPTTGSLTHTPDPERAESSSNNKDMNDISSVHSKMNGLLINDISHGNVNGSNGVSQLNGAEAAEEIVATSMPAPKASTESAEKKSESSDQTNTTVPSAAKEDDAFVTASNDSTDGTWENLSRSSQAGEKTRTKAEIGSDDDTKSWEHVEPVAQLKEAPPPAENIWKKRLAENKAKQPLKSADSNTERGNGASPNAAKNGEQGRADARRKSRPSQTVEEKPGFGKGLGDRARSGEEAVTRGVRSSTHQKASPPKAPLPPTSDEMFWPTPDLAKEEEKKKQQEKIEKTEKSEKELTPKSHTKPSGSRLGGRGGRLGGAGRGGYSGEAGPNDGKPGGDTTGPPSSSERAKGDMGPPRPGPLGNKPKRSSSAGPHTAREQREQRKPGDASKHAADASSEPKHTPTQTSRETPRDSRRTSVATQTSDVHSTRQGSPTRRASGYYGGNQEGDQSYARTTPDRRYEESNRPDHYRDPNGYSSMRERGEGRGEARRGNYRGGRGGYNGAQGNYGSNNPSYTVAQGQPGAPNNMPAQQNNTAYTPTKAQSYSEQRHYSQPQVPPYSQPRENRHTRNNSRSQSIPNSIPPNNNPPLYARYSAAGGPLPSPNGLPLLHTDLANMYAYRPGSHPARGQSTAAFTPFMLGQAQLQGMVQTQM